MGFQTLCVRGDFTWIPPWSWSMRAMLPVSVRGGRIVMVVVDWYLYDCWPFGETPNIVIGIVERFPLSNFRLKMNSLPVEFMGIVDQGTRTVLVRVCIIEMLSTVKGMDPFGPDVVLEYGWPVV